MSKKSLLALAVLLAANFVVVWGQSFVSFARWRHVSSFLMPESRYYLQSLVVLVPLIPLALLRFRHGRKLLVVLLLALAAHAVGYLVKAHVPGSRRNQYVAACDWAAETIRADYKGLKRDVEPFFSQDDYHPLGRPVLVAHAYRLCYLLEGRPGLVYGREADVPVPAHLVETKYGLADIPDYIVDESRRINRDWWAVADFEKLAERRFGQREFVIYKRVK